MITSYRQALEDIVASDKYNKLDDFTVVLQPVLNFNGLPLTPEVIACGSKHRISYSFRIKIFNKLQCTSNHIRTALWI